MDSIAPECSFIKHKYDECFNKWFSSFLKGNERKIPPECESLFSKYQACVKPSLEAQGIIVDSDKPGGGGGGQF